MSEITPEAAEFLRSHLSGILATGRRDGSPQMSAVGYHYDGAEITVSAKAWTAKYRNAQRNPRVSLAVHDGHAQAIVYGTAECISEDPQRADLTVRMLEGAKKHIMALLAAGGEMPKAPSAPLNRDGTPASKTPMQAMAEGPEAFLAWLDEQERVIIRITPDKVLFNE